MIKETIFEKYARIRPSLKTGDVILFEGVKIVSDIIRESDDCQYTHVGIILNVLGTLFIIDSNRNGVQPSRLSERIAQYETGDFIVKRAIKSEHEIKTELALILKNTDRVIKYDFINGAKSLINRFFKTKLNIETDNDRMICSEFVKPYAMKLEMIFFVSLKNSLFFPQDFIRYENEAYTIK